MTSSEYYGQCAIPKPIRVRDESVLDWARSRGVCEVCGLHRRTFPCHVKTRGSGGPDTMQNIFAGCWECHRLQEDGHIPKSRIREIIAARA